MDKITRRWANSGNVTAPSTGKQDLGWVDNEQVPYEWWNWLQDRLEAKCNEIIEERVNSYYDGASDWQTMLQTGLWADSWGNGADSPNAIESGASKELKAMCPYLDSDSKPHVLVFDDVSHKVERWNTRSLALISASSDLTADLPSGGGEVWECQDIATDGVYVYITFMDSNASPETHQIQAWKISDWSVHTGWVATGTALSGTGTGPNSTRESRVVYASSSTLAVVCSWITISASSSTAIAILDITDGSILSEGAGDCPTGTSAYAYDLASDGTNIFFLATGSGGAVSYTCSATIADPTTGCGGANYPLTHGTAGYGYITSAGPNLIVSTHVGGGVAFEKVRTGNSTDADLTAILNGTNAPTEILENPRSITFDGINIWIFGEINNNAGTDQFVLVKIDASRLASVDTNTTISMFEVSDCVSLVGGPATADDVLWAEAVFDGRDMWVIAESRASQTNSGKIWRLPLALLRG